MNTLPEFELILKSNTGIPSFLKTKEKIPIFGQILKKKIPDIKVINAIHREEVLKAATIEKKPEININALTSVKDSDQSYDHYLKLMDLVKYADEGNPIEENSNKEKSTIIPGKKQNNPLPPQTDFAFYKPSKPHKIQKTKKTGGIKEKERLKRMKGQSSQNSWKPEAYMKLRQEFD